MLSATADPDRGAWPSPALRHKLLGLGALAWLAVAAGVVMRQPSPASWSGNFLAALACLILWAGAFAWHSLARHDDGSRYRVLLVFLQAILALAGFALLRDATVPILLVVVAAQLPTYLSARQAGVIVLLATLGLYFIAGGLTRPGEALTIAIAFLAFQSFSLLLAGALLQAEQSRAELAAINSQLLATQVLLHESVRDRERLRIARELHDLIGHKLTALQLNLQVAARIAVNPAPEIGRAREIAGDILKDIRNVVAYVPVRAGMPLQAALVELARSFPESMVRVEARADARIEDVDTAQSILRCAQEATSNAIRHGRATQIVITLSQDPGELVLAVVDNGTGLRSSAPGFGLSSIESRVRELGGRFTLREAEPRGAALRIVIPTQPA